MPGSAVRCARLQRLKIVVAVLAFTAGAMVYVLYRGTDLIGHRLLFALGLGDMLTTVQQMAPPLTNPTLWHMSCVVPDGLWILSYVLIISYINRHETLTKRMLIGAIIPLAGILSELLQLTGHLPGVYDPLDIVAYILPYFAIFL